MALSRASGSDYSGQKRGHAHPMFNVPFIVRPMNSITAGDLKAAAGTSLGLFSLPDYFGQCLVLAIGFTFAAAGGAETTHGSMEVEIAGDNIEVASATLAPASVASHTIHDCVESSCNNSSGTLEEAPEYPLIAGGQLLEWKVNTQGVGAGDQTVYPYAILVRRPSQA